MNLFQTIRSLQTIADSNPYINNVGDGSIYQFLDANPSIKYGVFFVTQTTHRENELFDWYGFNLFVVDRLIDDLESNRLQIQSIAKDVLSNTIKTFCTKFYGVTHNEIRYVPFTQRFSDLCAGQYCTVELRIPKSIICEEDFEDLVVFTGDCKTCYDEGYADGLSQTYEDGFESGRTYQKSLLVATQFTENGTYAREDGYSVITVNVDVEKYYNSGWTEGYQSGVTDQKNKLESITITDNGTYSREDGYSQIVVDVECISGDCSEAYESGWTNGYVSGNTDGYEEGYADGLADCSGSTYEEGYSDGFEDGYQSGYTDGINACDDRYEEGYESGKTDGYESGYTGGYDSGKTDGIDYQKSLLEGIYITDNGQYNKVNGYSSVTVNINTQAYYDSGYTSGVTDGYESGYTGGYDSGKTDGYESGITYQKSLLTGTAFTENGTYTRENGWSAVTINIDTQAYYDSGYTSGKTDGYESGYTGGYDSGYTDGLAACSGTTPFLMVSPERISAPESGTVQQLLVASTTDWIITNNLSWVTLSTNSGGSGITPFVTTIDSNIGSIARTGSIIIKTTDNSVTRTVSIAQQAKDYSNDYTTFNIIENGYINWYFKKCVGCPESVSSPLTIQYRKNGGDWTSITSSTGGTRINVVSGDIVEFKGENQYYWTSEYNEYSNFEGTTAKFRLSGNINSMFFGDNFTDKARLAGKSAHFLFAFCAGLVDASGLVLPSTQLDASNYYGLFEGSTNLVYSPSELPATTLYGSCYAYMFSGCTSLITAPKLPATILKTRCYSGMFQGCTSLTTAPALPATTLDTYCYYYMFNGCTNLNYIKCLATNKSASNCVTSWVDGVAANGTFVKNPNMTGWGRGINGIPSNWTIKDA